MTCLFRCGSWASWKICADRIEAYPAGPTGSNRSLPHIMKDIRPCRTKTPAHRTVPTRFRQGYEGRVLECAPFGARCGDFRMQTRIIDGKAIARELRGEL